MQWTGQQAVVTLPQHIDISNASQIREQLLWIINRGAAVLIADLTGTLSCDYSGADALARAHHRAIANGTELRLAVTAHAVRRVLTLNGFDRLVAIYPDLDAAAAAGTGRREQPTRPADHAARTEELLDGTAAELFDVGLILQAAIDLPRDVTAQRITEALRRLDEVVREVRNHMFAGRGQSTEPGLAWIPPPTWTSIRADRASDGVAAKARGANGECSAVRRGRHRGAAGAARCSSNPARAHRLFN